MTGQTDVSTALAVGLDRFSVPNEQFSSPFMMSVPAVMLATLHNDSEITVIIRTYLRSFHVQLLGITL